MNEVEKNRKIDIKDTKFVFSCIFRICFIAFMDDYHVTKNIAKNSIKSSFSTLFLVRPSKVSTLFSETANTPDCIPQAFHLFFFPSIVIKGHNLSGTSAFQYYRNEIAMTSAMCRSEIFICSLLVL